MVSGNICWHSAASLIDILMLQLQKEKLYNEICCKPDPLPLLQSAKLSAAGLKLGYSEYRPKIIFPSR